MIEKKANIYRGNDCIKKFCSELKDLGTKIVNYEQKEMTPLITNDVFLYERQKVCYICKESFVMIKNKEKDLNYTKKLEIIVILLENLEELLIAFVI